MITIVGEGSQNDRHSLPLHTRDGTFVPNFRRPEATLEARREIAAALKRDHQRAKLRSSSSTHNCVGHLFAARRTWVESDHLLAILKQDGFSQLRDQRKLLVGDIVVYEDKAGEITHVGQVVSIHDHLDGGGRDVSVLSKWGQYGEYIHDLLDVPLLLGIPKTFWTERREL